MGNPCGMKGNIFGFLRTSRKKTPNFFRKDPEFIRFSVCNSDILNYINKTG